MLKVNPEYKTNRPKLLRDIRILRQFFGGKIPQETTNDPEQLRITIAKCKRTLQDEVGDVGLLGIAEQERTQASGNAPKFDVTMNMSRMSPVENNGKVLTEKQCINPNFVDTKTTNTQQDGRQKYSRTNKVKKKRKRKSKSVYYTRSSSNYESSSSDGSRSSSSDRLHSRKQPKKASTRRKQPHYNQHLHSMTSFTHLPVTQAHSQQPFYGNQQMGTFPVGMHMLPAAYNYFDPQSSSIPHSTLQHIGLKQQTSDLNTTAGEQALGKTTVTEGTKRPHEGSSGLNLLFSAAYLCKTKVKFTTDFKNTTSWVKF